MSYGPQGQPPAQPPPSPEPSTPRDTEAHAVVALTDRKRPIRRVLIVILGIVGIVAIITFVAMVALSGSIEDVTTSIEDALISDSQHEFIDEVSRSSSCTELRGVLVEAQQMLAAIDSDQRPSRVFPERLEEAAHQQIDSLGCGG